MDSPDWTLPDSLPLGFSVSLVAPVVQGLLRRARGECQNSLVHYTSQKDLGELSGSFGHNAINGLDLGDYAAH